MTSGSLPAAVPVAFVPESVAAVLRPCVVTGCGNVSQLVMCEMSTVCEGSRWSSQVYSSTSPLESGGRYWTSGCATVSVPYGYDKVLHKEGFGDDISTFEDRGGETYHEQGSQKIRKEVFRSSYHKVLISFKIASLLGLIFNSFREAIPNAT